MIRSKKKIISLIYSQRESTDFEETQLSALLTPHQKCYLGHDTNSKKTNYLINKRIYQINVRTPRIFFYHIKLKTLHLLLNKCEHSSENATPEDYDITNQISSHKQTISSKDTKKQSKKKSVITSDTNSKRQTEFSDIYSDTSVMK